MNENVKLIRKRIEHLRRMQTYLDYSLTQTLPLLPIADFQTLTPGQHETLAAFRVRFSEMQEQLGKTMRAIALEEEKNTEPFSVVLLYMTKLDILDSVEQWKLIRESRIANCEMRLTMSTKKTASAFLNFFRSWLKHPQCSRFGLTAL